MSEIYDGKQYDDPIYRFPKDSKMEGINLGRNYRHFRVKKVDDYQAPRYVYANGYESEVPEPANGDIIGYRISPTLVISDMCGDGRGWFRENLVAFIKEYGGNVLSIDEVPILRQNYDTINKMRVAIGDVPLPEGYFWVRGKWGYLESVHCRVDCVDSDPTSCNIIIKRIIT